MENFEAKAEWVRTALREHEGPLIRYAAQITGDLDRASAEEVLTLMDRLQSELGKTVIMVTHDPFAAKRARSVRHLEKGILTDGEQ